MFPVIFKSIIIVILLFVLQFTIVPLISISGIVPDLLLIYLVIISLRIGQLKGTIFGFVVGFFFDVFSGGLIGSAMFSKTLASFVAGYFYKEDYEEIFSNFLLFSTIVFLSAFINSFLYAVLGPSEVELNFLSLIFVNGILPALYTSLIGVVYSLFARNRNNG